MHAQEVADAMEWYESQLKQMREFFEGEKEKLEARLSEDKERAQKRYDLL